MSDPFFKVRLEAENLIREQNIDSLPIDPFAIAESLGINLMAMPNQNTGASGMLIHLNGQFGIAYPTHVENEGFKRFSVAHEVGHYRLPGHFEAVLDSGGQHVSRAGFVENNQYEREADHFAAALLMPTALFRQELDRAGDGLEAIEKLAKVCGTSLESTAIRYVQCTEEPVALICSIGKKVHYAFMSEALRELNGIDWIRKGEPLPTNSNTYVFNSDENNIKGSSRAVGTSLFQDWFLGDFQQEITEEVVGLGGYGKTLTVLSDIELSDEDDDYDLEESWRPRF